MASPLPIQEARLWCAGSKLGTPDHDRSMVASDYLHVPPHWNPSYCDEYVVSLESWFTVRVTLRYLDIRGCVCGLRYCGRDCQSRMESSRRERRRLRSDLRSGRRADCGVLSR